MIFAQGPPESPGQARASSSAPPARPLRTPVRAYQPYTACFSACAPRAKACVPCRLTTGLAMRSRNPLKVMIVPYSAASCEPCRCLNFPLTLSHALHVHTPCPCADVVCRAVAEHQVQGWVVPHHGRRSRHEGRVRMNATGLLRHLHLLRHQLRSLCSGLYRLDGCCSIAKSALACSCPCDQPQPQRPVCTGLPSPPGRGCVGGAPGGAPVLA